jgi:lipid-binding SYLF domain-containing protein
VSEIAKAASHAERRFQMKNTRRKRSTWAILPIAVFFALSVTLFQGSSAFADDRTDATALAQRANLTLQSFMCDRSMGAFRDMIRSAKGVMIVPSLLKGAFIVGASGGSGALMVRERNGAWSGPAFYTIGGASFGLQAGGQSSEVILLAMTDRGVRSFLNNSFKLGGDVGVAVGPVGIGASAATANLSADIVSFSRSKGLYGGISLDGAVVAVRGGLNDAYYGRPASPAQILVSRTVRNPNGQALALSVRRAANATSRVCSLARVERDDVLATRSQLR